MPVQLGQLAQQNVVEHGAAPAGGQRQQPVCLSLLATQDGLQAQRLPHPRRHHATTLHHAGQVGAYPLQPFALRVARQGGQRLPCQVTLRQQQGLIGLGHEGAVEQRYAALERHRILAVGVIVRLHHRHQRGIVGGPAHAG
ncbi:hypothetical protein D3C77_581370 [compost metagenome]